MLDAGLAELIIVDTGSQDRTLEVSRKYTNQVYEHPWTNHFSEMRNISISYAKGEWILIIDADEVIENPEEMVEFFQKDLSTYNTIIVKAKNYMESEEKSKDPHYNISILTRAFRNEEDFCFKGAVHNQPQFKAPVVISNIVMGHYGYIWEDEEFKKKKFNRTAGILRQELSKNPNDIYYQYQLAVSTSIIDIREGIIEFRKAHKLIKKMQRKNRAIYTYTYGLYAITALKNEQFLETVKICEEGLSFSEDYIDLWFVLTLAYSSLGDNQNTLKSAQEFLKCKKRFHDTPISKDPAFTFYHLDEKSETTIRSMIANIYMKNEKIEKAISQLKFIPISIIKSIVVVEIAEKLADKQFLYEHMKEAFTDEEAKEQFLSKLEESKLYKNFQITSEEIVTFYQQYSVEKDEYYLLNKLREQVATEVEVSDERLEELLNLDFNELPSYYGDILLYMFNHKKDFSYYTNFGKVENVDKMLAFIFSQELDLDASIYEYLQEVVPDKTSYLKYWLSIANKILFRGKLEKEQYIRLFNKYIEYGIAYIEYIYHADILYEESIFDIPKEEHRFFLYMKKAMEVQEYHQKEYIQYLRKALKVYPLKKGIEYLLKQVKVENEKVESEMEQLKRQFKKNIKFLIEQKKLNEAEALIEQYEQLVQNDIEILLFKSEISLLKI